MGDLVLSRVSKSFGGLKAVNEVSFHVPEGAVFGLIGPNGAGKTTVFNVVTGLYKAEEGTIQYGGENINLLSPPEVAAAGIARTFQNIRLFGQLSVLDNLLVAGELHKRGHLFAALLRTNAHFLDRKELGARAEALLDIFALREFENDSPHALSYGNQRKLEIARALMVRPSLLLLDEPAAGMNYGEAEGLKKQITWLRDEFKLTVVLVEHNMQVVMGVCEEIHVLDHGETLAHGKPEAIRNDPKVITAYLGEEDA